MKVPSDLGVRHRWTNPTRDRVSPAAVLGGQKVTRGTVGSPVFGGKPSSAKRVAERGRRGVNCEGAECGVRWRVPRSSCG